MNPREMQLVALRVTVTCSTAAIVMIVCGCQVGRRWFQIDSNSRSPVMGVELRADAADGNQTLDDPEKTALTVDHVEPEPRRGLRDWLRFPGGEEQIPLPTTLDGDADGTLPMTGPRPEFE